MKRVSGHTKMVYPNRGFAFLTMDLKHPSGEKTCLLISADLNAPGYVIPKWGIDIRLR